MSGSLYDETGQFIRLQGVLTVVLRYDSVYDNITAITTIDSNDFSSGGEGSGKLKFHVSSYSRKASRLANDDSPTGRMFLNSNSPRLISS